MAKKKENPLLTSAPSLCECGGKVMWKNGRFSFCLRCYEAKIKPLIPATAAEIAFNKRLHDVEEWIEKHSEFKTKRDACKQMLKKRGLIGALPEHLR